MNSKNKKLSLYEKDGTPSEDFNKLVIRWLKKEIDIKEHNQPKQLASLLQTYEHDLEKLLQNSNISKAEAHKALLSNLTNLMFGDDITSQIEKRLSDKKINQSGFRSIISQSVAKNTGENFVNIIVYSIADVLSFQDEILVDKGIPKEIKDYIKFEKKEFEIINRKGKKTPLEINIESDLCIFSRTNPLNAIIISAKTRLKEVFHIGTMWKLFFDMIDDEYCQNKWGLTRPETAKNKSIGDMMYVFATADMISKKGHNTQGCDVERDSPRNLIAVDASFFDYVFVSKQGINHVSEELILHQKREALFHELGCLLDLIEQKYNLNLP